MLHLVFSGVNPDVSPRGGILWKGQPGLSGPHRRGQGEEQGGEGREEERERGSGERETHTHTQRDRETERREEAEQEGKPAAARSTTPWGAGSPPALDGGSLTQLLGKTQWPQPPLPEQVTGTALPWPGEAHGSFAYAKRLRVQRGGQARVWQMLGGWFRDLQPPSPPPEIPAPSCLSSHSAWP